MLLSSRSGLLPMFGTSGGTFLPTSVANLWAWWDIATLSTLFQDSAGTTPVSGNGDPIGYIADRSGNGRYVRQIGATGTRPTYTTGVQNGLPASLFDAGDYLDSVATINSYPLTIIGVFRTSGTVGTNRGIVSAYNSTTGGLKVTANTANQIRADIGNPVSGKTSTATVGANTTAIFGAESDTTNLWAIVNTEKSSTTHALSAVAGIVSLGRLNSNSTSSLLSGSVCEVLVYNRSLIDTETTNLTLYLNSKWMVY